MRSSYTSEKFDAKVDRVANGPSARVHVQYHSIFFFQIRLTLFESGILLIEP